MKPKTFFFPAWFISQTRRIFRKYPGYYNTLNKAKRTEIIGYFKTGKPNKRVYYTCNNCKQEYKMNEVVIDHIIPVVDPDKGYTKFPDGSYDWNDYLPRLYCDMSNLQVLCKEKCHQPKSNKENKQRRKKKAKKKLDK